jgi:predicted house-cleaning noncanonical NTP pyrophosphatase (MazG superfamily)
MGGNPTLVITINPNESSRELTIQGVDSLGITKAMFNKVLRVIGTSGNQDGEEIGQFGMGFISYALLTDALLLETWSRENNEHYAMLCDSGLKFKPIPLSKDNDVETMSDYGTKLTMTCNNDVSFSEAVEQIQSLARFSQIPTTIILLDNVESTAYRSNDYQKGIITCPSYKNGMEYIKQGSDLTDLKSTKSTDDTKILFYEEITIDNEDYRFDGIMIVKKSRYGAVSISERSGNVPLLLAGTGIDSIIKASGFQTSLMNVKNERKFSPVASRDSLEYNSRSLLEERLKEDLIEYMSKFNMETIEDYNSSLTKCLISRNVMWEIEDYLSDGTKDISRTLNSRYSQPDKTTTTLSDMLAVGGTIICLKSLRGDLMKALEESFDGSVSFFRLPKRLSDEARSHRISLFKQLGIIMGEDYKKEHKIKEKRSITIKSDGTKSTFSEDRSIVLYNSTRGTHSHTLYGNMSGWRSGSEKYSTTIGDVNSSVHDKLLIANTKQFHNTISVLNRYANDWKVMHDMKGLSEEVNTFDNLMSSIATTHYQTNDGFVKGSELEGKYYVIITGEDTALLESVTISNELQDVIPRFIAVKNNDELTELLWYQDIIEPRSSNDPLPPAKFTLDFDTYGHALSRSIFVAGYDEDLKFTDHDYDLNRAVYVLRSYWIKQLLPSNYSKVFIHAIQNDVESLDDIEAQAQALNEVLKK